MSSAPVLIAAGGTGGHIFPAEALAHALARRGVPVVLATDHRGERYRATFPARSVHVIEADTVRGRSPRALASTGLSLGRGFLSSFGLVRREKPRAVVGFGGYPTLPPLVAALATRVPIVLHEQNAVLGRANRLLARVASRVATGFPDVAAPARKTVFVGNPVRPAVAARAASPYPARAAGELFHLLAFGGSQGARVMGDIVPDIFPLLSDTFRSLIRLTLQVRPEDLERVRAKLGGLHVEVAPFFADMPDRIAASHLVVARSGASTVAELAVIGRPAILVPLPGSLDQDQAANARALERIGGAMLMPQDQFTPERMAAELARLMAEPGALARMAQAGLALGRTDGAERLADLVLGLQEQQETSK